MTLLWLGSVDAHIRLFRRVYVPLFLRGSRHRPSRLSYDVSLLTVRRKLRGLPLALWATAGRLTARRRFLHGVVPTLTPLSGNSQATSSCTGHTILEASTHIEHSRHTYTLSLLSSLLVFAPHLVDTASLFSIQHRSSVTVYLWPVTSPRKVE